MQEAGYINQKKMKSKLQNHHLPRIRNVWRKLTTAIAFWGIASTAMAQNTFTMTKSMTNITCNSASNGTASFAVTGGGTPPYAYSWNTVPAQFTSTAIGLSPGTYTVYVSDAAGNSGSWSFPITQPSALSTNTTTTNVTCFGDNNGSSTVVISGGVKPYSYLWSSGETGNAISGKGPGAYVLTVTDSNGCQKVKTVNIIEPYELATSTQITHPLCYGDGILGSAIVSVSRGMKPYTYLWSTGETTNYITGKPAGSYVLTITDANGCVKVKTVDIIEPKELATSTQITHPLCYGDGTLGSAIVNVSRGTKPYSYSWSSGETSNSISGKQAGTYVLTITDANGCTKLKTVNIVEPFELATSTVFTNALCFGTATGGAIVSVSRGTKPYSYVWNSNPVQTTNELSNVVAGSYTLTITDSNNCVKTKTVSITEPATEISTIKTMTGPTCYNGNDGTICVTASGGTGALTYSWNKGQSTSCIQNLTAGVYVVYITDANGCQGHWTITLTNPAPIVANVVSSNISCFGGTNGTASVSVLGGSGYFTYLWSNGSTNDSLSGLVAGTYNVVVSDTRDGCSATASGFITEPSAITTVKTMSGPTCYGANNGEICVVASGGTGALTYSWNTGQSTSCIQNLTAGVYVAYVTDANGCQDHWTITLVNPAQLSGSVKTIVNSEVLALKAFPNPSRVSSTIQFSSTVNSVVKVEVLNNQGNPVVTLFEGKIGANEMQSVNFASENFSQGIYICRIVSNDDAQFIKLVIQK